MTKDEMVTGFKLEEAPGKPVTMTALLVAVGEYCKPWLEDERFHDSSRWEGNADRRLPERWRALLAFWLEGGSEGWYVHIGVLEQFSDGIGGPGSYIDIGFVKVWSHETAKKVTLEAQRFLEASRWN